MDTMLSSLGFSVAYLNDILINSKCVVQHKAHVHKLFAKIQDYGFKMTETKCDFFIEKIKYLGHITDKDGRWRQDPEQAAAIEDMPAPDDIASCQSFLGQANYYQVFIEKPCMIWVTPKWTIKERQTLRLDIGMPGGIWKIKKTLTSELFLTHYNTDLEIIVASNASSYGVGVCILHKMTDGTLKPIAHVLRPLLPAGKKIIRKSKKKLLGLFSQS